MLIENGKLHAGLFIHGMDVIVQFFQTAGHILCRKFLAVGGKTGPLQLEAAKQAFLLEMESIIEHPTGAEQLRHYAAIPARRPDLQTPVSQYTSDAFQSNGEQCA